MRGRGRWGGASTYGSLHRVVRLVWDANSKYLIWAVILTIVSSLALPGQFLATKLIFDRILPILQGGELVSGFSALVFPIVLTTALWVLGELAGSMQGAVRELLGFEVMNHARYLVLEKASRAGFDVFESPEFHDKLENALKENNRLQHMVFFTLDTGGQILSLVSLLALLVKVNPWFLAILLATSSPQILIGGIFATRKYKLLTGRASALRMVDYVSRLLSMRESKKEVALLGLERLLLDRLRQNWKGFLAENERLSFGQQGYNALLGILSISGTTGIWAMAIRSAASKAISLGDLTMVVQASTEARSSLSQLFLSGSLIYENTLFISNLFDFLDMDAEKLRPAGAPAAIIPSGRVLPAPCGAFELEFQNVSFRYPKAQADSLSDVSLTFKRGRISALVGANGSGKSTLIKLATRLYEPTAGRILLDGRDIREYDIQGLRRRMSVGFQDFIRYYFTARENIGFGQVERLADTEGIIRCAKASGSWGLVGNLPEGLETRLGKVFEKGMDLSGGQWQTLAISRAYMREESGIIMLDEPTAALDPFAEHGALQRLMRLAMDKTAVFVSHRFSSVRSASQIFVLRDGRLIEEGSHGGLMAMEGEYARMFTLQADAYK